MTSFNIYTPRGNGEFRWQGTFTGASREAALSQALTTVEIELPTVVMETAEGKMTFPEHAVDADWVNNLS